MTFKSLIMSLLLSAFVSIAFHDYLVGYYHGDTQIENALSHMSEQPLCTASTVHEIIHHSMVFCATETSVMPSTPMRHLPYFTKPSQRLQSLQKSIDRPPIA